MNPNDEGYNQDGSGPSTDERHSPSNPSRNSRAETQRSQSSSGSQSQGQGVGAKMGQMFGQKLKDKAGDKIKEQAMKRGKEAIKNLAKKSATALAKKGGKELGKQGAKLATKAALHAATDAETAGISAAVIEGIDQAQQFLRHPKQYIKRWSNRLKWALIAFIALIMLGMMFLLLILTILFGGQCQDGLTISMTGPETAKNGDKLEYKIQTADNSKPKEVKISDHIPDGTEFDSASNDGKYDAEPRTVTWSLTEPGEVTLTLKATQDNTQLANIANAESSGGSEKGGCGGDDKSPDNGGGGNKAPDSGGNVEPSTNDCGYPEYKKFMDKLPGDKKGKNFGDPNCEYVKTDGGGKKILDKDKLLALLKEKDPGQADKWFCLAGPESNYNPNAFLGASTSGEGAYGLFQMNPPGKGKNESDNGYVVWTKQVENAIKLRQGNNNWNYWDPRSRAPCHI